MLPNKTLVMVVDDDEHMLGMMGKILEMAGYSTVLTTDGKAAIESIQSRSPDLVLLDVMMPGIDGYAVCRRIREFSRIPVIMVTARDSQQDKIDGLDAGADDYIAKPFSARELLARVRAVTRRSQYQHETQRTAFSYHGLAIDFASHRVTVGGREIDLTATEYCLLAYLALNAGSVLTSDQIMTRVWGEQCIPKAHLLWVNMARLRKKLEDDPRKPRFIITRSGLGYTMPKQDH